MQPCNTGSPFVCQRALMCFLFPCQLTFIFHLSYQLILRFRWIRFVANSFEVYARPPCTTPLQRNKTKTLRSYKCKPVILLVSAPWLTNGTADGIFPLHFNLEYIPCSFYLLASIFCCCELHNSFPLRRPSLRGLHCESVMIFNYPDACTQGVKGRWGSLKDQRFGPEMDFLHPRRCIFLRTSAEFCLWTHRGNFQAWGCACQ